MKAEDEKLAEETLAKCAVINIEELQYKNEIQIIRPSEALEAMEAYYQAKLKEIATNLYQYWLENIKDQKQGVITI